MRLGLRAILVCLLFCRVIPVSAAVYYVDSAAGNDLRDGLSPASAWQTLGRVNAFPFASNDSILFIRNGTWRGQLIPASGSASGRVTYADYGTGAKPLILGSVNRSAPGDWISEGGNIWRCTEAFPTDVGNLIFDGEASCGVKKWALSDLAVQGDFFFDKSTRMLRLFSAADPGLSYSAIECALRRHIIDENGRSYVTYRNLALKYGGAHGIGGGNTHHITVADCEISYTGGGDLDGVSNTRFGNGIEFWAGAHDNVVERCRIYEIYDSGLTNQNAGTPAQQYNITYRNNFIWNCSLAAYEYFSRPASSSTHHIYFDNNTCVGSGFGWGGSQRPDPKGGGIVCWSNEAATDSILIRNNIFYQARRTLIFIDTSTVPLASVVLRNNCYSTFPDSTVVELYPARFDSAEFPAYQALFHSDQASFVKNPVFSTSSSGADCHLAALSPCIDAGTPIDNFLDIDSDARNPMAIDIGADECYPLGVKESTQRHRKLTVYPNPSAHGIVTIRTDGNPAGRYLIIRPGGEVAGRVEVSGSGEVDVRDLPGGIYFLFRENSSGSPVGFVVY